MKYTTIIAICFLFTLSGFAQSIYLKVPDNFPSNYILTESNLHCENGTYFFYPDRTLVFKQGCIESSIEIYKLGFWSVENNKIEVHFYKVLGKRPVGQPLNLMDTAADEPQLYLVYELYENFENWIVEKEVFVFNELNSDFYMINGGEADKVNLEYQKFELNGEFKIASCRYLTPADLKVMDGNELRLMRNEIFARYAYKFKSIDLQKYFCSKYWYKPLHDNVDIFLTDIEKRNIVMIKNEEANR